MTDRPLDALLRQYLECRLSAVRDRKGLARMVAWWRSRFAGITVQEFDLARVLSARAELLSGDRGRARSPATVNRYITTLLAALNLTRFGVGLHDHPARISRRAVVLREPPPRVRYLEPWETHGLLLEAAFGPPYLLPLIRLALLTGLRRGELLNLRWVDVDRTRRALRVRDSKNGNARTVYLCRSACEVLQSEYELADDITGLMFPGSGGLSRAFVRVCVRAGISDFRFHDLRHTTASWLAMEGRSLLEIAELLGHKTLAMTRRYAHLAPSHLPGVMDAVAEKYLGAPRP